ncbi:hypothetical protein GQ42DRAFT_166061, partial [Ramicandelaber brevisporus]
LDLAMRAASSTNGYGVSTQHNETSTYNHLWWVVEGWWAALAKLAQSSAVENTWKRCT